jgi:hypothetical protein
MHSELMRLMFLALAEIAVNTKESPLNTECGHRESLIVIVLILIDGVSTELVPRLIKIVFSVVVIKCCDNPIDSSAVPMIGVITEVPVGIPI